MKRTHNSGRAILSMAASRNSQFFFSVCKRGLKIMEVHPVTMNWLACLYECTGKAFALNPVSAFAGGGHSVGVSKTLFIL